MKLCPWEWEALLIAALLVWAPLLLMAWGTASGTHSTDWLLVLIGVGQLAVLAKQASISERQRELMAEQAKIAVEQVSISTRQIALEEKRFSEEFRPKIIVRNMYSLRTNDGMTIRFALFNVGKSLTRIGCATPRH